MSGRRPVKKGSFETHLDELVKHFHHEPPEQKRNGDDKPKSADFDGHCVHDRLFESAWRKAREDQRPATNSQMPNARSPAAGGS